MNCRQNNVDYGRTGNSQPEERGYQSCCRHFEGLAILFSPPCLSSFSRVNEMWLQTMVGIREGIVFDKQLQLG